MNKLDLILIISELENSKKITKRKRYKYWKDISKFYGNIDGNSAKRILMLYKKSPKPIFNSTIVNGGFNEAVLLAFIEDKNLFGDLSDILFDDEDFKFGQKYYNNSVVGHSKFFSNKHKTFNSLVKRSFNIFMLLGFIYESYKNE